MEKDLEKVDDGWQLLPKIATDEMRAAFNNAGSYYQIGDKTFATFSERYAALLAAAPSPPAPSEPTIDTTKLNRGQVIQRIMRVLDHNDAGSGGIAKLAEEIAEGIFTLPQSFQIGGKNETLLLKEKIDTRLDAYLSEMKPHFDDSIAGFNEAWDIVRKLFIELGVAEEGIRTTPLALCTLCKRHSSEPCDKGSPVMRLGCRQFKEKDYYEHPEVDYP